MQLVDYIITKMCCMEKHIQNLFVFINNRPTLDFSSVI